MMRQPGYVGLSNPRSISPRRHRPGEGLSRYEILRSGDPVKIRSIDRPYGFGPDGPSDKELVQEILQEDTKARIATSRGKASGKKGSNKKKAFGKVFLHLSRSTPVDHGSRTLGTSPNHASTDSGSSSTSSDNGPGTPEQDGLELVQQQPAPDDEVVQPSAASPPQFDIHQQRQPPHAAVDEQQRLPEPEPDTTLADQDALDTGIALEA